MNAHKTMTPRAGGAPRIILATAAIALAWLVLLPGSAPAELEVTSFDFANTDQLGGPYTQAGGHPDENATSFELPGTVDGSGNPVAEANLKTAGVDLPHGLIANPLAYPRCTEAELASNACPSDTQLGTVELLAAGGGTTKHPIANMLPAPGQPAQFAFNVDGVTWVHLYPTVHPDGSLTVNVDNISQVVPTIGSDVRFWGVPADPSHDAERRGPGCGGGGCPSGVPALPFLRLPTSCTGPQPVTLHADSWQDPGNFVTATVDAPATSGCSSLAFDPQVTAEPTTTNAASPSGMDFGISIDDPGLTDPNGTAASDLKKAVVTLPEGMSVNPSSADGLEACSPQDVAKETFASDFGQGCPAASKIGSVEIETPLLEETLGGSIFLAKQNDNPFDALLATYIVLKSSERGISITLAGLIEADPDTGQLVASFDNNPELPFSKLEVQFKSGDRAPLSTPSACGIYEIETELVPHSGGAPVTETSEFTIDRGPDGGACLAGDSSHPADPADLAARPFNPTMAAGTTNSQAGAYSPFIFRLSRDDGDQELLSTEITPPEGLTAKLAGVPLCSEAAIAAISCPAESKIGSELAAAGAGPTPFYTTNNPGSVYMAGPYDPDGAGPKPEAPLSMVITEPVIAGPFDLDDVSVRAAAYVDSRTAQITVASDPIPQINSGIPLQVREIWIRIDRPDFTINPTDCAPKQVAATVAGSHGATANLARHFQASGCGNLGFAPKLNLSFGNDKRSLRPGAHPPLDASLSFNEGDSNIAQVEVALPKGVLLDDERISFICSQSRYEADNCPESSLVGYAKATTPLLDDPVEGPVYLKASNNPLPDLAADLNGQIDVDLFGKIDQKVNKKGLNQIRNTFDVVPDVPVTSFELNLAGGADGLLENSTNICSSKATQRLNISMVAHNERTLHERPLVGSACSKLAKKDKKKAKKLKKKAKKLAKKAKKTKRKARKASGKKATKKLLRKAKKLKKKAKKLKQRARKLGR